MRDVRTVMRGFTVMIVVVAVAAGAGCKGNATCEKFVEMSMNCPNKDFGEMSDEEKSQTKGLLVGMCENAMNDSTFGAKGDAQKKMMKEMNATIRKKAECVAAAKTCGEAKKCNASDD